MTADTSRTPEHLISYVPEKALESIRSLGLLSGDELAKPEHRAALELARSGEGDDSVEAWLKFRESHKNDKPWTHAFAGPSVLFGPPDDARITDKHPARRFKTVPVRIKLKELLAKHPGTKIHGSELVPYEEEIGKISDEEWDAMTDEQKEPYINRRHHDLTVDEVRALITSAQANPSEFWKHYNDPEGKRYAGNVPHAQVITPHGKIDPEFLEFPMEKIANVVIDQPKGSRKEFGLKDYPLQGVTYPTDYGSHPDYLGQDESDLDFFQGTGDRFSEMDVWRPDVAGELETKILHGVTPEEEAAILKAFAPVVRGHRPHADATQMIAALARFKKEKLIRYTHGGEGTWRKTKAIMDKLPPELVEKINAARAKFHRPDLDPTGEYESYFTEGGAKKYEDELLPLHRQALGDDIKREEIAADTTQPAYADDDQRIFTKKASTTPTHELVFGPSGAGKTTKANQLAEETGLPIFRIDDEPEWKPFVAANDYNRDAEGRLTHIIEGTPTNKEWKALMRKLAERALARKEPHIIEGTHLMTLTPDELRGHNLHLVNPPLETVKAQRVARSSARRKEKGSPDLTEAEIHLRERLAEDLYNSAQPAAKVWESVESEKAASTYVPLGVPKPAPKPPMKSPMAHHRYLADDDEHEKYAPVGIDGLLAATEKLLAVNRGLAEPDDRDSLPNDRIYTVDRLMAERVKLDHGRTLRAMMGRLSRIRNLAPVSPDAFGEYTVGYIRSNPLVPALEEINPMHILEQKRRITKMGPGGIGDPNAITEAMQMVSATQFGFVDPISGPECTVGESEVYTKRGWVKWRDVLDDDQFACRIDDRFIWGSASRVVRQHYVGDLIVARSSNFLMRVTPNHRVLFKRDPATKNFSVASAGDVAGKPIRIPRRHLPLPGDDGMKTFTLPDIGGTNGNQKRFAPFDIVDWCAYMGWWLSEGNSHTTQPGRLSYATGRVGITQCRVANPENYAEIRALCLRMGICDCDNGRTFLSGAKQLVHYFSQWTDGCYDKWIPEELFHAPLKARLTLLDALIKGDGRSPRNRLNYCTVSRRLAESVERLAIELGYAAYIREEKDSRPHVKTTNYVVSLIRGEMAFLRAKAYAVKHNGSTTGNNWSVEQYDGMVYCATVPGGFLYVRGDSTQPGYWTGNSEKAGIDVRLAHGTKIGSDGRIYQLLLDRKSGKKRWVSPSDMRGKTLKLPD